MPGFGLDGQWRDYVGWALNIEQVSGMTAATGGGASIRPPAMTRGWHGTRWPLSWLDRLAE